MNLSLNHFVMVFHPNFLRSVFILGQDVSIIFNSTELNYHTVVLYAIPCFSLSLSLSEGMSPELALGGKEHTEFIRCEDITEFMFRQEG